MGYELGRLYAVDEDSGRNGEVRYRLEFEENLNSTQKFAIDELTGVLTTIGELDREEKEVYEMKVGCVWERNFLKKGNDFYMKK